MLKQIIHDETSAPEASRAALAGIRQLYGFIPNLTGAMAGAPALLEGYAAVGKAFGTSSLSPVEREVVTLTVSRHNRCVYCMSGHSMLASMAGMAEGDLEALRGGGKLADARLEALRVFTQRLLDARGGVSDADLETFLAAGFSRQQAMEVPLGIAFKTLSNYSHRLQPVPVDKPVEPFLWQAPETGDAVQVLVAGWLRPDGGEALARYQAAAGPLMGKHGGKPVLKSKPVAAHAGSAPDVVVVLEFPSSRAVEATFTDPEYTPLLPLREQAFARLEVVDLGSVG